jgi:hypothetical protein
MTVSAVVKIYVWLPANVTVARSGLSIRSQQLNILPYFLVDFLDCELNLITFSTSADQRDATRTCLTS